MIYFSVRMAEGHFARMAEGASEWSRWQEPECKEEGAY